MVFFDVKTINMAWLKFGLSLFMHYCRDLQFSMWFSSFGFKLLKFKIIVLLVTGVYVIVL